MRPCLIAAALSAFLFPLSVNAETYTATSAPTAVTVYNNFAMVTRTVRVGVAAGTHEIVMPDLPQWIDDTALRVSVAGAQLAGTRVRTDALPPAPDLDTPAVRDAKKRIDAAVEALRALDDRAQDAALAVEAAEARLTFLRGLATSATLPSTPQALADLGQMIEAQTLEATQTRTSAQRDVRKINDARPDLEQDIADARAALAALTPPATPAVRLTLSVTSPQEGEVIAQISYPAEAYWQPTYDVMLTRDVADRMTLRRAALVYQNSGENWDDVILTLSTLAPTGQVIPTEVYPPLLRFEDPQLMSKVERSAASLEDAVAGAPAALAMEAAPVPQPNFDGPGVTYTLAAPLSIARGAEAARVELDTLTFNARVFARAVPSRDETAFLVAEGTNTSLEPLLAASGIQIFRDGAMVGRTGFAAVPAGATFTQAFGPIEDLRLSYDVLDQSEGDRGLINRSNAQIKEIRMGVENLGQDAWDVELQEGLPYTEQDDLEIEWTAQPPASQTNVDDRRGLAQWNFALGADEAQTIELEQSIRWPEGTILR